MLVLAVADGADGGSTDTAVRTAGKKSDCLFHQVLYSFRRPVDSLHDCVF